ncbi:hypothetical protein Ppa06_22950 [Planomonospora parontospora subsp. parontospora]|uniref:Uncharacterized protein n=2 Tax=Planomonospora parontospora TaxID=58119 RepID=A0AA37F4H8_9ACTN|nr:hypothetical protein GCM10010126_27360 [Planomonospora parontospora]GII08497.1 hypothetical protein Ppa06_22950 [Planomonospora parontospora subsp. parontospora]
MTAAINTTATIANGRIGRRERTGVGDVLEVIRVFRRGTTPASIADHDVTVITARWCGTPRGPPPHTTHRLSGMPDSGDGAAPVPAITHAHSR